MIEAHAQGLARRGASTSSTTTIRARASRTSSRPSWASPFPGATLVCCDSHTCTVGGVGALALGHRRDRGRARARDADARAGRSRRRCASRFDGQLAPGVYAKDMILALIGKIGAQGGIGYAVEFAGPAIARACRSRGGSRICNMAIEFSGKYGFVPPDDDDPRVPRTAASSRPRARRGTRRSRTGARCATDAGAAFDREVDDRLRRARAAGHVGHQPAAGDRRSTASCPTRATPRDREARDAGERALGYMRLEPGTPLDGVADRRGLHRLVHQRAALGPARGRRGAARAAR